MTIEQIEQAAIKSADEELDDFECRGHRDGFIAGAQWRINSVWHDARKEVPEIFKSILVERDDFTFSVNMVGGNMTSCPLHWVRWAYVSDLLPERKEETK